MPTHKLTPSGRRVFMLTGLIDAEGKFWQSRQL